MGVYIGQPESSVDAATVFYPFDNNYAEPLRAVEFISEQHGLMEHRLEELTFDRESSIVAICKRTSRPKASSLFLRRQA